MPDKNITVIKEFASIYEQGSINENFYKRSAQINASKKNTLFTKKYGDNSLVISNNNFMIVKTSGITDGEKYKYMDSKKHIKNRYIEMQASLNLIAENTLLGVGLGNFQNIIGTYYNKIPKVNTAEINQHNGFLIIASTMGILGLASMIWFFSLSWRNAKRKFKFGMYDKCLFLGLAGSILACFIESIFSNLFIASLLTPFIFIFYLTSKEN